MYIPSLGQKGKNENVILLKNSLENNNSARDNDEQFQNKTTY